MKFIPKHYCLSNKTFLQYPLIEWTYTDTILVTAYDLLRNDSLIYFLQSNNITLKEMLRNKGFPSSTKILADTGIFSLDWCKYVKEKTFAQDYSYVKLRTCDIIEAYKLINPDLLVSPDEIILFRDSKREIDRKIDKMKENLHRLLEHFSSKKIIGVIQGLDYPTVYDLFDFQESLNIVNFARGGLIPISWNRKHFCKIIRLTKEILGNYSLHAFGASNLDIVRCYCLCSLFDSFDSTLIKGLTSDLFYLKHNLIKQKFDDTIIKTCNCLYCRNLEEIVNTFSYEYPGKKFLVNLYLHNTIVTKNFCENPPKLLQRMNSICYLK